MGIVILLTGWGSFTLLLVEWRNDCLIVQRFLNGVINGVDTSKILSNLADSFSRTKGRIAKYRKANSEDPYWLWVFSCFVC